MMLTLTVVMMTAAQPAAPAEGTVALAGRAVRYRLVGRDRLLIDADGDGRLDPLCELYPVGTPVTLSGRTFRLTPDAAGTSLTVAERPAGTGDVRFTLGRATTGEPTRVYLGLAGEWGDSVFLTALGRTETLPAGVYRVRHLSFALEDPDDEPSEYAFTASGDGARFEIRLGETARVELLPALRLAVDGREIPADTKAGQFVRVRPVVRASNGLTLVSRRVEGWRGSPNAVSELRELGSVTLDRGESCFTCSRVLSMVPLRVPVRETPRGLEILTTYDTGPLAGMLLDTRPLSRAKP